MTGAVDLVLPVAKIPEILAKYGRQMVFNGKRKGPAPDDHRLDRSCTAIPRAAVPNDRPRHREAHAHCAAAGERLCDDRTARPSIAAMAYSRSGSTNRLSGGSASDGRSRGSKRNRVAQ
jgi:hypothetical protein